MPATSGWAFSSSSRSTRQYGCRRTASVCEALAKEGHGPMIKAKTGLALDPYFSATKLQWILDHTECDERVPSMIIDFLLQLGIVKKSTKKRYKYLFSYKVFKKARKKLQ